MTDDDAAFFEMLAVKVDEHFSAEPDPELRPYQHDVIADFERACAAGKRRIMLVAPTGSGKTVIASAIIKQAVAQYRNVLVLAHRREIIAQTSAKLHASGVAHGIIQAGFDHLSRPMAFVQVASVQTLTARAVRTERMELPPADLFVIDEAHHTPAATYRQIIDLYPDAMLLGLTATPCRGDGCGLGGIFETLIECPQIAELIAHGYLVKTRVYAPTVPDLKGVRVQAGDYVEAQLAARMDRPQLVGDIVSHCTNTARAERRSPLPSTSRTPFTYATSSSSRACAPSISTARHRSRNAMRL